RSLVLVTMVFLRIPIFLYLLFFGVSLVSRLSPTDLGRRCDRRIVSKLESLGGMKANHFGSRYLQSVARLSRLLLRARSRLHRVRMVEGKTHHLVMFFSSMSTALHSSSRCGYRLLLYIHHQSRN